MVFNPQYLGFKQTADEAGGHPDYAGALKRGLELAQTSAKTLNTPRQLSEDYLSAVLKNQHDKTINKYLDESERTRIDTQSLHGKLYSAQLEKALADAEEEKQFKAALGNYTQPNNDTPVMSTMPPSNESNPNVSAEGPGVAASPSTYDTFPGRRTTPSVSTSASVSPAPTLGNAHSKDDGSIVVSEGDPSLAHIDKMYDENPIFRKKLEARGFKKKSTVKVDPKTGATSIVTQWPSGRVESKSIAGTNPSALTNKIKTQLQGIETGAPKVIKKIDDLINTASPAEIPFYRQNSKAAHSGLVWQTAESYATAMGWPNVKASIERAALILDRHWLETDSAYHKRLRTVQANLKKDADAAHETLNPGSKKTNETVEWVRDMHGKLVPSK